MKLIGIDQATMQLRLPRGAPYHLKLRTKDADGEYQAMSGRDLALTLYRAATVLTSIAGVIGEDDTSPYAAFALVGDVSAGIVGPSSWEIAEVYSDGKAPLLNGAVYISGAAGLAAGDGSYVTSSAADEATWTTAGDVLVVTERGPRGPAAEGVADPGDLTLIFDNHLI